MSVYIFTVSWLNLCTDYNKIGYGDTLILEEGNRLRFDVITGIHTDGAAGKD